MDPLTHFLDAPRATRAFALVLEMSSPWAIDVRDGAALTAIVVSRGSIVVDGHELGAGDVALVQGPDPYVVSDAARSPVSILIGPDQHCTSLDGRDLREEYRFGVRRWGNTRDPHDEVLVGAYARPHEVGGLVTRALPPLIIVPAADTDRALVGLLVREVARGDAAAQVLVDRLLDVLVVGAVRHWLRTARGHASSWLTTTDPVVVRALDALHTEPAAPWTVDALAQRVHVSRAALAARFRAGVGEPPIAYLTRWRVSLASDLLLAPDATVSDVARRVGYDDPFAFSTAFKRIVGASPTQYRRQAVL